MAKKKPSIDQFVKNHMKLQLAELVKRLNVEHQFLSRSDWTLAARGLECINHPATSFQPTRLSS